MKGSLRSIEVFLIPLISGAIITFCEVECDRKTKPGSLTLVSLKWDHKP
jgi:hypothetical protein